MTNATLTGRHALVTGGSRGIGAGIVRRLTADGAAVAFTYSASKAEADDLVAEVTANGAKAVASRPTRETQRRLRPPSTRPRPNSAA